MVPHDGSSSPQAKGLSVCGRTKEKNSHNENEGKSKNGYRGMTQSRDNKYCRYCKRDGHDITECFKLQNKEKRKGNKQGENSANVARDDSSDDALVVIAGCAETNDEWILDTACTLCVHIEIGLLLLIPLLLLVPFWVLIIHHARLKA